MYTDTLTHPAHSPFAPLGELTPAEQRVLALMAEGLSNCGIAERLTLSDRTVENYVRLIFIKLGLMPQRDANRRVRAVLRFLEVCDATV